MTLSALAPSGLLSAHSDGAQAEKSVIERRSGRRGAFCTDFGRERRASRRREGCRHLDRDGLAGDQPTGGGFGGCTINLVKAEACADFTNSVARKYERSTGVAPEIYICRTATGVNEVVAGSLGR